MGNYNVAIVQFPGSNCEYETQRAFEEVGCCADIISWNEDASIIASYHAYVLPGGFSFQDRVRAGVVSSKLPVLDIIKKQADLGKPVLGICNGCQILAEANLIDFSADQSGSSMALAPNIKEGKLNGFVCDWVYVKVRNSAASLFTSLFEEGAILPIQINHGEGNFKFLNQQQVLQSNSSMFLYCNAEGEELTDYPVNPNGSDCNIAGICNSKGNVLAMMPHPERGFSWHHVPRYLQDSYAKQRRLGELKQGPWIPFFKAMAKFLEESS